MDDRKTWNSFWASKPTGLGRFAPSELLFFFYVYLDPAESREHIALYIRVV